MELNFNISEFNISGKPIPETVCDKILHHHILPMQKVRNAMNENSRSEIKITASLSSGYRSVEWEKAHGRRGGSQHCFHEKGAVDWTCTDFDENKDNLLEEIIEHTDYTRIAVYAGFIHCDYKRTPSGKRELYTSGSDSRWTKVGEL